MNMRYLLPLRNPKVAYALLFTSCYAAFVYWQHPTTSHDADMSGVATSNAGATRGPLMVLTQSIPLQNNHAAGLHTADLAPGNATGIADAQRALTAEQEKQSSDAAITAMGASNTDARITALQQLTGIATPDVMMALNQSLRDRETRIRYVALESLRQLAANQGDADGSIRSMIRNAMSDRDPQVASKAASAYEELNALLMPQ